MKTGEECIPMPCNNDKRQSVPGKPRGGRLRNEGNAALTGRTSPHWALDIEVSDPDCSCKGGPLAAMGYDKID